MAKTWDCAKTVPMKNTLKFFKYSGNGNDFIILDQPLVEMTPALVQKMCDRHFGVGADGILTLTEFAGTDGEMRIYNADGGEAEMCGNGLRCLATYIDQKQNQAKNTYRIKTMNATYELSRQNDAFAIEMSQIKDQNLYDLSQFNEFDRSFFINTGVPHLVFLVKDAKAIDIKPTASRYRFHSMFPNGTNVSFVEIQKDHQTAYVRTYERGVEDETYSCGTGLTASALALNYWNGWKEIITLKTLGGTQKVNVGNKVFYSGEVKFSFAGEYNL